MSMSLIEVRGMEILIGLYILTVVLSMGNIVEKAIKNWGSQRNDMELSFECAIVILLLIAGCLIPVANFGISLYIGDEIS